jgi:hypothetical protein
MDFALENSQLSWSSKVSRMRTDVDSQHIGQIFLDILGSCRPGAAVDTGSHAW